MNTIFSDRVDVVSTPLVLRLYVKVDINLWVFSKTLFKKELWKWSSASSRSNIKYLESTITDETDPRFQEFFANMVRYINSARESSQNYNILGNKIYQSKNNEYVKRH